MDHAYSMDGDQERRVEEVLRRHVLPAYLTGYTVEFRDGWFGDPLIWVSFHLNEDGHFPKATLDEMNDLRLDVALELFQAVPDRSPFVRFVVAPNAAVA